MKVKDLLGRTEWRPGSEHDSGKRPLLSVLLPTFRRGRDGLFLRAARSVLGQSLGSLELIIVDDASTDGTADVIRQLMEEDGRVSCLTHADNIGLPAVSAYEAFMKSRGEFIGFAFDDFLFEYRAFELLVDEMKRCGAAIAHGYCVIRLGGNSEWELGRDLPGHDKLVVSNFVGNGSTVMRREAVEEVGLYDPHVALTRLCDWDLWRRAYRKLPFLAVDVEVGCEFGASRGDSLGNTYPMHQEVMQEFMNEERDELLRPSAFPQRDVLALPDAASLPLEIHVRATRAFFQGKSWYASPHDEPTRERRKVISIYDDIESNAWLHWTSIPQSLFFDVNHLDKSDNKFYEHSNLIRSDAVMFSGSTSTSFQTNAFNFCRKHKVATFYFADERSPIISLLGTAFTGVDPLQERRSHFEELVDGRLLKGFAFEGNMCRSALEIVVDGKVIERIQAARERDDLLRAGIGDGKHGFLFPLPNEVCDGAEHIFDVRWVKDGVSLNNSPQKLLTSNAATTEENGGRRELELESFRAVIASSPKIKTLLETDPAHPRVLLARPIFDDVMLAKLRRIRSRGRRTPSDPLRIGLMRTDAQIGHFVSTLLPALRLTGTAIEVMSQAPLKTSISDNVIALYEIKEALQFGVLLERLSAWAPDIVAIPPTNPFTDEYRSDADLLLALYIGAVPVSLHLPCFDGWDEKSGVYRIADSIEGWAAAISFLSERSVRVSSLNALEAACRERFMASHQEDLLKQLLGEAIPLDYQQLFERYRSAWSESWAV